MNLGPQMAESRDLTGVVSVFTGLDDFSLIISLFLLYSLINFCYTFFRGNGIIFFFFLIEPWEWNYNLLLFFLFLGGWCAGRSKSIFQLRLEVSLPFSFGNGHI